MEWTKEEDAILRKKYPLLGVRVKDFLLNRTRDSIEHRARRLGIRYGLFPMGEEAYFDIETTNFNADIAYMLSYAFKTKDKDEVFASHITKEEIFSGEFDKRLVKDCISDLQRFKRIYTYYGTGFDLPFLRTRALELELDFPIYGTIQHQDLYYLVRNKFKLTRNRLENITKLIGIDDKTHIELKLWRLATIGDEKALEYIFTHNIIDVKILEEAHKKIMMYADVNKRSI